VQQRKLAHQLPDVSVAGEPVEQDSAGGPGVLGSRPLPGGHIPTVGQNHRSPRGLPADARRPAQRSDAARHAASLPYELRDAREPPLCVVLAVGLPLPIAMQISRCGAMEQREPGTISG
jgi:hypothetical protein